MALGGTSARCTSSPTTCFPSSRAERSLKEVPALTNGVRRPATIATRRPGRVAMASSGEVARVITALTRRVNCGMPDRSGDFPNHGGTLFLGLETARHHHQHVGLAAG